MKVTLTCISWQSAGVYHLLIWKPISFLTKDSAWSGFLLFQEASGMEFSSRRNVVPANHGCWSLNWNKKEHSCERKEMGRGRWKHELNWSCLFQSFQQDSSRSLQPQSRERTEKPIEKRKKSKWNWNRHERHWSGILEEFSVLFLYSCILMSLLQLYKNKNKKNSYGNSGFLPKVSSCSRINSSLSIATFK